MAASEEFIDVDGWLDEDLKLTIAEKMMLAVGSWRFISIQSFLLFLWIMLNTILAAWIGFRPYDPFPFVFLNLMLSFQAAYTGPIILMAQNAQAKRDATKEQQMRAMIHWMYAHDKRDEDVQRQIVASIVNLSDAMIEHTENLPDLIRNIVREELRAHASEKAERHLSH